MHAHSHQPPGALPNPAQHPETVVEGCMVPSDTEYIHELQLRCHSSTSTLAIVEIRLCMPHSLQLSMDVHSDSCAFEPSSIIIHQSAELCFRGGSRDVQEGSIN